LVVFACIALGLVGILLLGPERPSGGFAWDAGNGLGVAALAAFALLTVSSGRGRGHSHQICAWLGLIAVVGHTAYFLFLDQTLYDYVQPGAPFYMWCGIAALVLVVVTTFTALPRFRRAVYASYPGFVDVHWGLSTAILALCIWHVIGAGLYVTQPLQQVLLAVCVALFVLFPWLRRWFPIVDTELGWWQGTLVMASTGAVFALSRIL
jgi:hypothetical protein